MADDNDRRGAIVAGATAALIGGLGVFFGANGQEAKLPTPVAVDTTQTTPTDVTIPSVDDLAAAVTDCQNLPTGSQERIDCGRGLVDGAKGALVDALATNADQADIESLWADTAKAIALGIGEGDDPSVVFPAGALPAPSAGASANTVTCAAKAGTRRNLGVAGTLNRPSGLGIATCEADGSVILVALFRNSGGYYADSTTNHSCTGARCAVQAGSNSRCGKYRSYVVAFNRNEAGEAGPITDAWSKEQKYCNPKAA